jgi:hypothetical protein
MLLYFRPVFVVLCFVTQLTLLQVVVFQKFLLTVPRKDHGKEWGGRRVGEGMAGMGIGYHVLVVVRNLNWRLLICQIL